MPKPDPYVVDDDNPPLSDRRLAALKPASAVFTREQLAALSAAAHAVPSEPEVDIRLRISSEALAAFKAEGPGWETRMRTALERAALAKA